MKGNSVVSQISKYLYFLIVTDGKQRVRPEVSV